MAEPIFMIPATADQLAAIRSAVCKGAPTSLKNPNSIFALTALIDKAKADGPAEEPTDKPEFTFTAYGQMTDDDLGDVLEGLADMVRDGYTSGDAQGAGWWSVSNLTDADDMPKDEDEDED